MGSVVEEFKATKTRAVSTLQSSKGAKIKHKSKGIKGSRKWNPQEAVQNAEEHLRHQEIVGLVCQGKLGLGHYQ